MIYEWTILYSYLTEPYQMVQAKNTIQYNEPWSVVGLREVFIPGSTCGRLLVLQVGSLAQLNQERQRLT